MATNKQISQLPAVTAVGDDDLLVVSQGGVASKATGAQVFGSRVDDTLATAGKAADAQAAGNANAGAAALYGVPRLANNASGNYSVEANGLTETGTGKTDAAKCRTSYIKVAGSCRIVMTDGTYAYRIWEFGGSSVSSFRRTVTSGFIPGTTSTLVGGDANTQIKAVFCDAADPTRTLTAEDYAAVSERFRIFLPFDGSLSVAGAVPDSKSVGDAIAAAKAAVEEEAFVASQSLTDGDDADTIAAPGSYAKAAAVTVANLPNQKSGHLYVFTSGTNYYQFWQNNGGELWYRYRGGSWILANPNNTYGHSLAGKTVLGLGDSFMRQAGSTVPLDKQWFSLIGDKYCMTYINNGLAGSPIAKNADESAASMVERIETILTEHTNTSTDVTNGTQYTAAADYFVLCGGANDSTKSVPLGNIDSTDETEFHGAINLIIAAVRAKFPRARILLVTNFHRFKADTTHTTDGHNRWNLKDEDYANAMVESARFNGVPCVDSWHTLGIVPAYGESGSEDYVWCWISTSNKHLSVAGNAFVAPVIAKAMERI